jgi:hypothetical protein
MERIKILIIALLLLAAAWFAYQYLIAGQAATLELGNEVNAQTFLSLFGKEDAVYVVMDVRDVTSQKVKTNILQCGVDFAGSTGLLGKNQTYYSFDSEQGCVALEGTLPLDYCMKNLNDNGMTIYVKEANSTKFYTNAMVVGVGQNYSEGECSIKIK